MDKIQRVSLIVKCRDNSKHFMKDCSHKEEQQDELYTRWHNFSEFKSRSTTKKSYSCQSVEDSWDSWRWMFQNYSSSHVAERVFRCNVTDDDPETSLEKEKHWNEEKHEENCSGKHKN